MAQNRLHNSNLPFYMSLTNTKLPGFILADLFKTALIDLPAEQQEEKAVEQILEAAISFVGQNQHYITIGVYAAEQQDVPADHLQFLTSILKACQRTMDHVAVVNFGVRELLLADLVAQLQPRIILLFGAYHVFGSWMIQTEDFSPFYLQQIQIVRVPALEQMLESNAESRILKSKLWNVLKQLFNL